MLDSNYYRVLGLLGATALLSSILTLIHFGFSAKSASFRTYAAGLYLSYVIALVPTLGVIGSSGDHLCYLTAGKRERERETLNEIRVFILSLSVLTFFIQVQIRVSVDHWSVYV
jgi:hypothetical protein